jgi:hypothetical protein
MDPLRTRIFILGVDRSGPEVMDTDVVVKGTLRRLEIMASNQSATIVRHHLSARQSFVLAKEREETVGFANPSELTNLTNGSAGRALVNLDSCALYCPEQRQ